jgi:DNA-binding transcriptional LysR family regulator
MAQITLKQLDAFVAVADLGSFRRAAEKLHTTQPNISARIAALEGLLQHKLMHRDAGSVRLTPRGTALLAKARAVLAATDDLIASAGNDRLFDGTLRLGVTEMIVHSWLGPYLAALRARFPNVDVALRVDVSKALTQALVGRDIDLALQNGPFPAETSGSVALGRYPMTWVAAPGLGLSGRLTLDDLAEQPILTHAEGTLPHDQIKTHIAGHTPPIRVIPSTNITAALAMTHQKLGVACMPEIMVQDEIATGRLVALDYPWRPDDLLFFARYEADTAPHYVSEAAKLAQSFLG